MYLKLVKREEEEEAKKTTGGDAEEAEDALHLSIQTSQYCNTRADVINAVQSWMTDASRTIAIFPSKRSVNRRRRTVDFVNKRKTKPIGEDENEEDAEWLKTWVNKLPEEPAASAAMVEDVMEEASPLRLVLRNAKQMITGKKDPSTNLLLQFLP